MRCSSSSHFSLLLVYPGSHYYFTYYFVGQCVELISVIYFSLLTHYVSLLLEVSLYQVPISRTSPFSLPMEARDEVSSRWIQYPLELNQKQVRRYKWCKTL